MTTSDTIKKKYHELVGAVNQERDEIELKIHLASMEAQQEWKTVETKWQQLKVKSAQLERESGDSAHEIGAAIQLLGGELKESYKRFKKIL